MTDGKFTFCQQKQLIDATQVQQTFENAKNKIKENQLVIELYRNNNNKTCIMYIIEGQGFI